MSPFFSAALVVSLLGSPVAAPAPQPKNAAVLRDAIARQAHAGIVLAQYRPTEMVTPPHASPLGEKIAAGVLGGIGGFYAGLFAGYGIDRGIFRCECDDPGLRGAVIGGFSGAALGSWLGVWLASR
ncbi:MAG: hypothetical protein ACRD1V_21255 [Vicinamibacterales bacterium]